MNKKFEFDKITIEYKNNEFKSLKENDDYIGPCIYHVTTPDGNSFELIPEKNPLPNFDLYSNRPAENAEFVGYYKRIIPIFKYEINNNYILCFSDIVTGEQINVQCIEIDTRNLTHSCTESFNYYEDYDLQYRLELTLKRLEQKVKKYDEDQRLNKTIEGLIKTMETFFKVESSVAEKL